MTRLSIVIVIGLVAGIASGCAKRQIIRPAASEPNYLNYIYFVEQESGRDSRLKRCDIAPDNRVSCETEYALK